MQPESDNLNPLQKLMSRLKLINKLASAEFVRRSKGGRGFTKTDKTTETYKKHRKVRTRMAKSSRRINRGGSKRK